MGSLKYIVLFGAVAAVSLLFFVLNEKPVEYPNKHHIRYSFVIENPTERVKKNAVFWTYAPLEQSATQKRISINTSHPYKILKDKYGNERMYFQLGDIAPRGYKIVKVDSEIATTEDVTGFNETRFESYMQPQRFIESNDIKINKLSRSLMVDGEKETVRNIYDWVSGNLSYSGYLENDKGAKYALEQKAGDCSEYAYLLTALSRSAGISSKVIAGFYVTNNAVLDPADYHNWSKVYYGDGWHVVDALKEKYNRSRGYIAFRIVGDEQLGSQKLFGTDDDLKIKMGG